MGEQPGARGQTASTDIRRERVHHHLVPRHHHVLDCRHDNFLNVLNVGFYDRSTSRNGVPVHIAILTFAGYNERDSLIARGVLNRVKAADWRVSIAIPSPRVRSMNGVVIES